MNNWLLKQLNLTFWPPILLPVVLILFVVVSPFYYSMPFIRLVLAGCKWMIGRWKCDICDIEYGPTSKKHVSYKYDFDGIESRLTICDACCIRNKLTK